MANNLSDMVALIRQLVDKLDEDILGKIPSEKEKIKAQWYASNIVKHDVVIAGSAWAAYELREEKKQGVIAGSLSPSLALVMKGGGVKGLAYVGAIEELNKHHNFNWYVGTSAGAITAILLAAGYTPEELKGILKQKNFKDFFDAPWYSWVTNLIFHKGIHKADSFTWWIDGLLAEKLNSPRRVLLSDLRHRVTVFASQRGTNALKYDSIDNDCDAAHAARCSMSIPFVFTPQYNQGLRTYDGGLRHNYPLDELKKDFPELNFVSLYLGSEIYQPVKQKWIFADLLSIWTEGSDADMISKYKEKTIIIDPSPVGTLDFKLTDKEKEFLLCAGKVGALKFCGQKREEEENRKTLNTLRQDLFSSHKYAGNKNKLLKFLFLIIILSSFFVAIYINFN